MQNQLLFSNLFALEECASLQPNSRSWQNETGFAPQVGIFASPMGYLLDAVLRNATAELRPVDGLAMQHTRKGSGMAGTGGMGMANEPFAGGGIMRQEARPVTAQARIGNYTNDSSGTISTFKKINTGSHSRLGGLPPLTKASAPPGRASADPGGGPTAS